MNSIEVVCILLFPWMPIVCCDFPSPRMGALHSDGHGGWVYDFNITAAQERVACYGTSFNGIVGVPSVYLGDFYGLQALEPLNTSQVASDAARLGLTVQGSFANVSISVKGPDWAATFYSGVPISLRNTSIATSVPLDFAEVETPDCTFLSAVTHFRTSLVTLGLAENYLPANPHVKLEVEAAVFRNTGLPPAVWPQVTNFSDADTWNTNVVVVIPDRSHGSDNDAAAAVIASISTLAIDWVGLEMVPRNLQSALDTFVTAPNGSPALASANATLSAHVDAYYMVFVYALRAAHKKGYALDCEIEYDMFRYGETEDGAEVRNLLWAADMGGHGRGAVMGGSAHFIPNSTAPYFAAGVEQYAPGMEILRFEYSSRGWIQEALTAEQPRSRLEGLTRFIT